MSIFNKYRDLLNKFKPQASSVAQSVGKMIPAYNAYQSIKTMAQPQYKQQAQQFVKQQIKRPVVNTYQGYIKSPQGQWFPKAGTQPWPTMGQEGIKFGTEFALGGMGAAPTPMVLGGVRTLLRGKQLVKFAPDIKKARSLLKATDLLKPAEAMKAYQFADEVVGKIGYKPSTSVRKMMIANPAEYKNITIGLFNDALDAIGHKGARIGLSTKELRTQPKGVGVTGEVPLGQKPIQSVDLTTSKTKQTKLPQVELPTVGGGQSIPSQPIIPPKGELGPGDPIQKMITALKGAKPIREGQEAIYSKVRSQQAGALKGISGQLGGETGYYKKLGQLKGELPKVQFESIKKQLSQNDINGLFNKVEASALGEFEKVNAQTGLRKLLGEGGGTIPTKSELKLLNEVFPPEFIQAVLDNRPALQKLFSLAEEGLNLPRAVMATADLSAPLRQGVFFVGRPKQFIPAFKDMFKYAFKEKSYLGLMDDIKARPNYRLMRESKLALTDMGPQLLSREEAFMSNLAEKIPGFGKIARGSNRAYSGFLNKLRADVFDDLVGKAKTQGIKLDGKRLEDLGSFINAATGRGNLGKNLQKAAPILNATFFSPRLMASRLSLLNPVTYAKYDPFVRKEALKSLLTFGGTALTVMGLASLGGAKVGADPTNADFGKVKVGNTRYDILGGFQQYIKLAAQLLSGKITSSTSGKQITLGEGYKPLTRKDIIMRFFEAKTAPVASFIIGLMTGQTGIGEPFNIPTEVIGRFIPMVLGDMYDLAREKDDVGKGLVMALPAVFGIGSQTYGKTEMVTGENLAGQPTAQIRPIPGAAEAISEKVFGKKPLGSTSSWNAETYYNQMLKMPKEEANRQWYEMVKANPELAKKIKQIIKKREKGVTVQDDVMKARGVASGERAVAIKKQFDKLKTPQEKAALWNEYVKKGIITKDVAKQFKAMIK